METAVWSLRTGAERITDLTSRVSSWLSEVGATDGLVSVFAPHATAGVALIEVGAGSDEDLSAAIDVLLPRDGRWVHRHGSVGHGADHVLPAFVSPSLVVPVVGGRMALGTWQSVVLVDPNADNPERQVRVSYLS
jgi:secondary thiamine-phosphate synthase enzyme